MTKLCLSLFLNFLLLGRLSAGLVEDIQYLANDALEGRQAGTHGGELATSYLIAQLEEAKVRPLGNSYQQKFTIFTGMEKNGPNHASFEREATPSKFEPLSFSNSGELESSVVFAGYGISIPKNEPVLQYDDYADLDVSGKIVIVLSGDPGIGNPQSFFRRPEFMNYRSLTYKLNNAIKHGAKGFLYVQDLLSLSGGNEGDPRFNALEGGGHRFDLLSGQVLNRWVNQMLAKSSLTTLDWQKKVAESQLPYSLVLEEKVHLTVSLQKKVGQISNVLAFVEGTDKRLKREVVVIGAHFDHLGLGSSSSREGTTLPVIHNGADDNASGTAMVLELAERIKKNPMKRSYLFAFFNAEEIGLLGSKYFVDSWKGFEADYGNIKAMLNFDMIGRYQKELSIMAVGSGLEWKQILEGLDGRGLNLNQVTKSIGPSDHASFLNSKIPVLYFTTGTHDDYHRSSDDSERINYAALSKISQITYDVIQRAEELPELSYNPDFPTDDDQGRERGYGAHLGCVPEFGQGDDVIGVQCTKATAGSPAEKAGILAGDVLIQLGEIEIKNIYDLVFVLKFYRPGDTLVLKWKRGQSVISATIVLAPPPRH